MLSDKRVQPFIVWAWAIALVLFSFSFIATDGGHVLLGTGGDGAKNYYTFLYHSLYEQALWFNGMNYPYGEHIVFPDLQPLVSSALIGWRKLAPLNLQDALRCMHWSICLSFVLAIVYNQKILRFYKVSFAWSLLGAACITLMSPQLLRLSGHYALAYPSFSAMLFYFSIRYHHSTAWKYGLYLFLLGTLMYFIHPYFLALTFIWVAFYSVVFFCSARKQGIRQVLRQLLPLWVAIVLMFGGVKLFMTLTDPVQDRPAFPHGAMAYGATGEDVLTSAYSPFWAIVQKCIPGLKTSSGGEGFSYIGLACVVIVVLALIRSFRKNRTENTAGVFPRIWIVLSLFFLLLGMGVPFVWNMEWLLHYLSVFRQFRSLGRFIWLFYQVITIFSLVYLYHYYQTRKTKRLAWLPPLLLLSFWSWECLGYIRHVQGSAEKGRETYSQFFSPDTYNWSAFLEKQHSAVTDFQAILLLPFIHVGSEKWSVGTDITDHMAYAFKASLDTRLPIVDVMMPRNSWSQTAQQVKIAGGLFADKPLLAAQADKPFLVLCAPGAMSNPDDDILTASSDLLGEYGGCKVYALYPRRLMQTRELVGRQIRAIAARLQEGDTVLYADAAKVSIRHQDTGTPKQALFGAGSTRFEPVRERLIAELSVLPATDKEQYEISSWVLLSAQDFRSPVLNLSLLDENGAEIYRKDALAKESVDNAGMWFRVNLFFELPAACRKIRWTLYDDGQGSYLALDEVLLRPANGLVISKDRDGKILVNNHLLHAAKKNE
ncbi:MAG: hypothetical protein JNL13_14625 [Chitinophagaceae bacterium]|nr:hypothetical protein [Chitinophagaceae bacterium]